MNELLYWIWLSLSCSAGSESFSKLINKFSTPKNIYDADDSQIASCISSSTKDYNSLVRKSLKEAERVLDFCESKHIGIVTYGDKEYPDSLRNIKNPPPLLYYRGVLPDFNNKCFISVVGTRRVSDYGRKNAFKVAYDLTTAGASIVSGMAEGIDGIAHAGAIAANGKTVAVLGCGINICYPKIHQTLAREIVKCGCVLTEYAPNTPPSKFNFPKRNRIISALASATLVIEGNERSGSLITARYAKEQGRLVYALPGNVGNPGSEACNLLIKNGARLFTSADDIVRDFDIEFPGTLNPFNLELSPSFDMYETLRRLSISCVSASDDVFKPSRSKKKKTEGASVKNEKDTSSDRSERIPEGFDATTLQLYKRIPVEGEVSVEELIDEELTLRKVMQSLLKLEIAMLVTMLPGDRVKRNLK